MSPSPTKLSPFAGDGAPSTGTVTPPPASCGTAPLLPNTPWNGPKSTGPSPTASNPQLPSTGKLPTIGPTPDTSNPDTGVGAGAPLGRTLALMSLSQPGVPANSSTDPLFRLTYGGALGLGQAGTQRQVDPNNPTPLYNPFQGAKR